MDGLHLAASTRYVLSKDRYKDISIETYFFKEDAARSCHRRGLDFSIHKRVPVDALLPIFCEEEREFWAELS